MQREDSKCVDVVKKGTVYTNVALKNANMKFKCNLPSLLVLNSN